MLTNHEYVVVRYLISFNLFNRIEIDGNVAPIACSELMLKDLGSIAHHGGVRGGLGRITLMNLCSESSPEIPPSHVIIQQTMISMPGMPYAILQCFFSGAVSWAAPKEEPPELNGRSPTQICLTSKWVQKKCEEIDR